MSNSKKERGKNKPNEEKITLNEMKVAIEKSGYPAEQRICSIIEDRGFLVDPSFHFEDQDTGKSREIDVMGYKIKSGMDGLDPLIEKLDSVEIGLLVECKNFTQPAVFFSQKNRFEKFGYLNFSGIPDKIIKDEKEYSIPTYFEFPSFHHNYKNEYISRQFCTFDGNKQKKWYADNSHIYEAVEKLSKATAYYTKNNTVKKTEDDIASNYDYFRFTFVYPILMFTGDIYEYRSCEAQEAKNGYELKKVKHLVLHRQIRSNTIDKTFYIDVITESYLPTLLKKIDKEFIKINKIFDKERIRLRDEANRTYKELGIIEDE